MKKATQQQTKEHNRNLVLKMLLEHDRISRAEIARRTTLTRTTVSDIVGDLIQEGLVREVGMGSSLGGKSPIMLSLVADARHVVGVDLAHDRFMGAVVDLRGRIIHAEEQPVPPRDGDAAVAAVYALLDKLVRAARTPIMGIGIGTPGLVDALGGVVVSAVDFGWQGLPLRRLIEARYHVPVSVLNDSQAAAMGEYTYGGVHAARSNLVVINVRYGIGAGIILNGEIFHGDGGGAGEIGHVVVVREGKKLFFVMGVDMAHVGRRYGDAAESMGRVRIVKDLDEDIGDRNVIVVEDIVDTGLTLSYLISVLESREPASVEVCALLDKSVRRIVPLELRYRGFECPDVFVVGYGLDFEERYRNVPDILAVHDMDALRADPDQLIPYLPDLDRPSDDRTRPLRPTPKD
jgi:hypoxanthine phosphoribosyltransferase